MRLYVEYDGNNERCNNFTLAESIYHFCTVKGNEDLDASVIAKMMLEQYWADSVKED